MLNKNMMKNVAVNSEAQVINLTPHEITLVSG